MNRSEYEDKILRVADRIRDRRETEGTARAYVAAKERIALGTGTWMDEFYTNQLEDWTTRPPIILSALAKRQEPDPNA